jgi:hypothetical protein
MNSRVINGWVEEGFVIEPFRALFPFQKEISYIPFRQTRGGNVFNYGKSRLDFFLVSPLFLDKISSVKYGDRLGADFDHKEVFFFFLLNMFIAF